MQDLADYLDISKNSVSQALRDKNGVSQETKDKVRRAAKELGYQYKSVAPNYNRQFILIASEFALGQTSFFGEIVTSVKQAVELKSHSLVIEPITPDMVANNELPPSLKNQTVDGIFILSHIDNEYIQNIMAQGLPCLMIDHHHPLLNIDAVLTQNIHGAYLGIEHLLTKGNRKIGFIGNTSFSPSYAERFIGYQQALSDHQILIDSQYVLDNIQEEQTSLFSHLDTIEKMPEAWFCVNSGLAFILSTYLLSKGYQIPQDVSILCFDNTEFTKMAQPPLTNISTDLVYVGEVSAQQLLHRLAFPDSPIIQSVILPTLNILSST